MGKAPPDIARRWSFGSATDQVAAAASDTVDLDSYGVLSSVTGGAVRVDTFGGGPDNPRDVTIPAGGIPYPLFVRRVYATSPTPPADLQILTFD